MNKKFYPFYIGITIGKSATDDSGICVLSDNNELIKIDKAYSIEELTTCVNNISGKQNSIVCINVPEYDEMLEHKWRIENKPYRTLKEYPIDSPKNKWTNRFSDRGSDFCKKLSEAGLKVFRYHPLYIKTLLNLHPYMKERTPAGCKFLQQSIKERLNITDMPTNMLPISTLDAILGAYLGKIIATGEENIQYKQMGEIKNIPVMTII